MKKAIVIGAGIVGLATARALAARAYSVTVLERNEQTVGASIRNFGLVLPIAQPQGKLLDRAMRSRSIWKELCNEGKLWFEESGLLLAVHHNDELQVIEEFVEQNKEARHCQILSPQSAMGKSSALRKKNLLGALWSNSELIVDPRQALACLPSILSEKYGVKFQFNTGVRHIENGRVYCGKELVQADVVFVCSGHDFETVYPEVYHIQPITKCKLQMLRTAPQSDNWRMGPALSTGLSLPHYAAFKDCAALASLKKRYESEMPKYVKWGVHVLATQQASGEVTLGDSHEYGLVSDPFDKDAINKLILDQLDSFTHFPSRHIAQTWNGTYAKMTNGDTELVLEVESGVFIINGLGGAGMTLSFGLAEEVVQKL